jgi:hypothetical protein
VQHAGAGVVTETQFLGSHVDLPSGWSVRVGAWDGQQAAPLPFGRLHELERVPAVNVQRNRTSRSKDIPARHAGFAVLAAIALPAAA